MHEFVAALGRWGRRLQGPEHRDTQGDRHNEGEGDVEVLAHAYGLTALGLEHKEKHRFGRLAAKHKGSPNQGVGGSDKHIFWAGIVRLSYGILPLSRSRSKILSGLISANVLENEIIGRSATYTMSFGLNSV